jgi:hypothetical protein
MSSARSLWIFTNTLIFVAILPLILLLIRAFPLLTSQRRACAASVSTLDPIDVLHQCPRPSGEHCGRPGIGAVAPEVARHWSRSSSGRQMENARCIQRLLQPSKARCSRPARPYPPVPVEEWVSGSVDEEKQSDRHVTQRQRISSAAFCLPGIPQDLSMQERRRCWT